LASSSVCIVFSAMFHPGEVGFFVPGGIGTSAQLKVFT
jgi:hypothetical protein